jgi:hypothetical protein
MSVKPNEKAKSPRVGPLGGGGRIKKILLILKLENEQ